jgi:hypothetical protein
VIDAPAIPAAAEGFSTLMPPAVFATMPCGFDATEQPETMPIAHSHRSVDRSFEYLAMHGPVIARASIELAIEA